MLLILFYFKYSFYHLSVLNVIMCKKIACTFKKGYKFLDTLRIVWCESVYIFYL